MTSCIELVWTQPSKLVQVVMFQSHIQKEISSNLSGHNDYIVSWMAIGNKNSILYVTHTSHAVWLSPRIRMEFIVHYELYRLWEQMHKREGTVPPFFFLYGEPLYTQGWMPKGDVFRKFSMLFEGDLESWTVFWSGLYNQPVTCLLILYQ
jgi:hypothetical protein